MKKRYEAPSMRRLTMIPEATIGIDIYDIIPMSLGWDNEGEV